MKNTLHHIIFLCCCILAGAADAQTLGTRIFILPDDDNTASVKINALLQLQNGYIMAATSHGLYSFDGISFSAIPKDKNVPDDISALCEVNKDTLWLGFSNGNIGIMYNNFIRLLPLQEGYPKVAVTSIKLGSQGIVWAGTAGEGVYYYMNKKLYNINTDDQLTDNYVYDMAAAGYGRMLAATDRGVNICTPEKEKKIEGSFTSLNGLPDNIVRSLYTSFNGYVWLGMQDAGVLSFKPAGNSYSRSVLWTYGQVNAIAASPPYLFAGTEENGLLVFNHDADNNITSLQKRDMQLKKISCLLRDREGNIWAAGNNMLMRCSFSSIDDIWHITKQEAENIHSLLFAGDSTLYYNTGDGITQLTQSSGVWRSKKFSFVPAFAKNISSLYKDSNGTIWIGTMGKGITLLNAKTGKAKIFSDILELANSNIISITGKNNTIWICSLEGTFSVNTENNKIAYRSYADVPGIGNKYVYHIYADSKNRVWFATDGNGVSVYENGKFSKLRTDSSFGNVVYKIAEDYLGNIWFSTYGSGLIKYNGKTFYHITTAQGLSDMNITGLAASGNNVVVFHKNKVDIINPETNSISYFDDEQGIGDINTELNSVSGDKEGNIYFVSDTLLCRYHVSKSVSLRPVITLDRIQLFLKDAEAKQNHVFAYDENNLSFWYTGLYYSQPGRLNYQFKLEDYNEDWVTTKDRVQNFPNLPPGTYTFRVRASLNQDFNGAPEDTFTFTIQKPLWLQWWFIVAAIAIAAGVVYLIVKIREREIKKYNRLEREKIHSQLQTLRNQINPHFLFNSFNTLILEIEENPEKAVTYVEHLSDFYRSIVVNREKDLISLEEEIKILKDYSFIQQKRYGSALQININVSQDEQMKYSIVPLALQLLLENAVKHNAISQETPLRIDVFINDDDTHLIIANNINKKMHPEKGSSLGLQNIQKRYEILFDKTVIAESDDNTFTVKIPLVNHIL